MRGSPRRPRLWISPPTPPETEEVSAVAPVLESGDVVEDLRLRDADMAEVSAAGVRLERVEMERVSLARVRLPRAALVDATLTACDLAGGTWDSAHLGRVEMKGCRLVGADFSHASFGDVRVYETNAEMVNFVAATLFSVRFEGCNLRGALFQGADLRFAVFRNCDLTNADLRGCKLDRTDLRGSQIAGLALGAAGPRGLIVDPEQALDIVAQLGARVLPLDDGDGA